MAIRTAQISVKLEDGGGSEDIKALLRTLQQKNATLSVATSTSGTGAKDIQELIAGVKSVSEKPILNIDGLKTDLQSIRTEIVNLGKTLTESFSKITINVDSKQAQEKVAQLQANAKTVREEIEKTITAKSGATTVSKTVRTSIDDKPKAPPKPKADPYFVQARRTVSSRYDSAALPLEVQAFRVQALAEPRAQVTRALEAERNSQAKANKTAVDNARQKQRETNEIQAERKRRKKEAADYAANEQKQISSSEREFHAGISQRETEAARQRKQTVGDAIAFQKKGQREKLTDVQQSALIPGLGLSKEESDIYSQAVLKGLPEQKRQRILDAVVGAKKSLSVKTVSHPNDALAQQLLRSGFDLSKADLSKADPASQPLIADLLARQQTYKSSPIANIRSLIPPKERSQEAKIAKLTKQLEETVTPGEFFAGIVGGDKSRQQARVSRAEKLVAENPALLNLKDSLDNSLKKKKGAGFIQGKNLLDAPTLAQIGFAGVFGGAGGIALATAGALTPLGKTGAFAASALQQGVGTLLDPLIEGLKKHEEEFKEAGSAYEQSLLSIQGVLQSTSQVQRVVQGPGGLVENKVQNIGAQLAFQERQAEEIQLASRSRLSAIGIGGSQESSLVSGVVNALAQKNLTGTATQIGELTQTIGAIAKATSPQLLDNPGRFNKEIQGFFAGRKNILSTIIGEEDSSKARSATSVEDLVNALKNKGGFAQALQESTNIRAVTGRFEGAQDNLNTLGGKAFLEAQRGGIEEFTKVFQSDELKQAYKGLGADLGKLANYSLEVGAGFTKVSAGLFNAVDGLQKFGPALAAVLATLVAYKSAQGIRGSLDQAGKAISNEEQLILLNSQKASFGRNFTLGTAGGAGVPGFETLHGGPKGAGFAGFLGAAAGPVLGTLTAGLAVEELARPLYTEVAERLATRGGKSSAELDEFSAAQAERTKKIQANRSEASIGGRFAALASQTGLEAEHQKRETEREQSGRAQLRAINREVEISTRLAALDNDPTKKKELNKGLAESLADLPGVRERAFEESTKGVLSGEGLENLRLSNVIKPNQVSAQQRLDLLSDKFAKALKTPTDRAADAQAALGDADISQATAQSLVDIDKRKVDAANKRFGKNRFQIDAGLSGDLQVANTNLKSAQFGVKEVGVESGLGREDLAKIADEIIEASREVLKYKQQEIDAEQKISDLTLSRTKAIEGSYDLRTEFGQQQQAQREAAGFNLGRQQIDTSIQTRVGLIQDQIKTIAALKVSIGNSSDGGVSSGLREELKQRRAELSQSRLDLQTQKDSRSKIEFAQLDQENKERQSNLQPFEDRKAGINTFGAAGKELFAQTDLQESRTKQKDLENQLELNKQRIFVQQNKGDAAGSNLTEAGQAVLKNSPQLLTLLQERKTLNQQLDVNFAGEAAKQQAAREAPFNRRLESADLAGNKITASHEIENEIAKRKELNNNLDQSSRALAEFRKSAEAKFSGKELSIAEKTNQVNDLEGKPHEFSDEQIKQAKLKEAVDSLNQDQRSVGEVQTHISSGRGIGGIARLGSGDFQTGLRAEGDKLSDTVRKNQEALERLPSDFEKLDAALGKTIANLEAAVSGKLERSGTKPESPLSKISLKEAANITPHLDPSNPILSAAAITPATGVEVPGLSAPGIGVSKSSSFTISSDKENAAAQKQIDVLHQMLDAIKLNKPTASEKKGNFDIDRLQQVIASGVQQGLSQA